MGGILPAAALYITGQAFRLLDEQYVETARVGHESTSYVHQACSDDCMDSKTAGDIYKSPFQKRSYRNVTHGPGYVSS